MLETADGIIDTKDSRSPGRVAEVYVEISMLYELMIEFESSFDLDEENTCAS